MKNSIQDILKKEEEDYLNLWGAWKENENWGSSKNYGASSLFIHAFFVHH